MADKKRTHSGDFALPPGKRHLARALSSVDTTTGKVVVPTRSTSAAVKPSRIISTASIASDLEAEPISKKILRHQNRQLLQKLKQRNEDIEAHKRNLDRSTAAQDAQTAALTLLATHWCSVDTQLQSLLGEEAVPCPDDSDAPGPNFVSTLCKAAVQSDGSADKLLSGVGARTTKMADAFLSVVNRKSKALAQLAGGGSEATAALTKELELLRSSQKTLRSDLSTATKELHISQAALTRLEKAHERLQTQHEAVSFELETSRNHISSLTVRLEQQQAKLVDVNHAGESIDVTRVMSEAAGGPRGSNSVGDVSTQRLQGELSAAKKEIAALATQLITARQQEAQLRADSGTRRVDAVKSTPEYVHLHDMLARERTQWNNERTALRGQVETMWHRIAVDRAAHDEMLAVDAERRAATETILAQCQEQLKEVIAQRDSLQLTLDAKASAESGNSSGTRAEMQRTIEELQKALKITSAESKRIRRVLRERDVEAALHFKDDKDGAVAVLQAETTRAIEAEKKIKLLCNVYQNIDKDKREKVAISVSMQNAKDELLALKEKLIRGEVGTACEARTALQVASAKVDALSAALKDARKSEEVLLEELETTGASLDEAQATVVRLRKQLQAKEEAAFELMRAKLRSDAQGKLQQDQRRTETDKLAALQEDNAAKALLIQAMQGHEKTARDAQWAKERHLRERELELDGFLEASRAKLAAADAVALQLKEVSDSTAEVKTQLNTHVERTTKAEARVVALQEQLKHSQDMVKRMQRMSTGGDDIMQQMVDELKKKINCSVNTDKPKDTVLLTCMHVFSEQCVKDRMQNRQRKCPKCSKPFGAGDVKKIWLD